MNFLKPPAIPSFSTGSILFVGASGVVSQDNSGLFWDNTSKRLGIGTATPSFVLHTVGATNFAVLMERTDTVLNSSRSSGVLRLTTTGDMVDGFGPLLRFDIKDDAGVSNGIGFIGAVRSGADNSGDVVVLSALVGVNSEVIRFTSNKNAVMSNIASKFYLRTNAPQAEDTDATLYIRNNDYTTEQSLKVNMTYAGTTVQNYRPVEFLCTYTSNTSQDPFIQGYGGPTSTIRYGTQTGTPVAAKGSCPGYISQITIRNSGDTEDEHTCLLGILRYDSNNNAFGNTTPGRAWAFDLNVHGSINQQQGGLGGVHMFMNNHYNGPPRDGYAGAFWAATAKGSGGGTEVYHQHAQTYTLGVGFGVVGFSSGALTRGWETGVLVGNSGSNWNVAYSHIGNGIDVSDYDSNGIWIHALYSGIMQATVTNGGSGYTSIPTASFTAAPAGGINATATARLIGTSVASVTVNNGGTGYVSPPAVTFDPPYPSGTTATGTAVLTGDVVTSVTITNAGNGYTTLPTVVFSNSPTGVTADGTVVLTGTSIASLTVTTPGKGYVTTPAITFSGGGGSGATAIAPIIQNGCVKDVTITNQGSGYSTVSPPTITFTGGFGTGGTLNTTTSGGVITSATVNAGGTLYTPSSTVYLTVSGGTGGIVSVGTTSAGAISGTVTILNGGSGYSNGTGAATSNYAVATGVPVINTKGNIVGVVMTNAGAGYTSAPTVTIAAPSPVTALGKATTLGGEVTVITISNSGTSYYSGAPTVTFNNTGTGGTGAQATAVVYFGIVKYVTITDSGSGYSRTGDNGVGGTVTINTGAGTIQSAVVSAVGSGYPISTTIRIGVAGGTNGVIELTTNGSGQLAGAITVISAGTGYSDSTQATYNVPIVTFSTPPSGTTATGIARLGGFAIKSDVDAGPVVFDSGDPASPNSQIIAPVEKRLTSDFTTTSTTAVNVTGLSFTIAANETWSFEFFLRTGSSSTAGLKLAVTFPSGATMLATLIANVASVTAFSSDLMTASGTLGLTINSYNGQTGVARITGVVTNGATAGTVQLQAAKVTSGTATISANSYMTARRIS